MGAESILVVNVGSSSVKAAAFDGDTERERHTFKAGDETALSQLITRIRPTAVGHRVVHGGTRFTAPVRVTPDVLAEIEKLTPLAPQHQPKAISAINLVESLRPGVPQVACFDTAFHATLPITEKLFALPRELFDRGIRRYGFHGLSFESIVGQLRRPNDGTDAGRVVVCHLGNGASVCGLTDGVSKWTTMGLTPLDGLVMATRCGRLDPGAVLYLIGREGMSSAEVGDLLEHRSGLLGVSGVSGDIRKLLADGGRPAREAIDMFCTSVAREIAGAAATLGGLDLIVFTGGIGEHSPDVRRQVCRALEWAGVRIDPAANDAPATAIHAPRSPVKILVLPTDEEAVIAHHCRQLIGS